jgi:hypothetical protein
MYATALRLAGKSADHTLYHAHPKVSSRPETEQAVDRERGVWRKKGCTRIVSIRRRMLVEGCRRSDSWMDRWRNDLGSRPIAHRRRYGSTNDRESIGSMAIVPPQYRSRTACESHYGEIHGGRWRMYNPIQVLIRIFLSL